MKEDLSAIRRGEIGVLAAWLIHIPSLALVFWWVVSVGVMPLWAFLLASYGAHSLLKVRTFLEHRAHEACEGRTVIVEDRGLFALLFLNNNYHVVHHERPGVPWYNLPALFRSERARFLGKNDGYYYRSYRDIFARYFTRAKDPVPHPLWPSE